MNFRKSIKSTHNYAKNASSLKKIQLNDEDLRECNQYSEAVQSTNESENSILNKLLLQPPSMKTSSKKLSIHQATRKYEQKFQKPDVQNLIQENINLKNLIQTNNHTISGLKIKMTELQKKNKLLESGLQKFQKKIFYPNDKQNIKTVQAQKTAKIDDEGLEVLQKKKKQAQTLNPSSSFSKTGTVHTQILKKKISDLTMLHVQTQNQLKFLKKLPNTTIYQQNDIEKQHLIAQTIRLKAIITSLSQQHTTQSNQNNEKFQNQFMRLMKQQNEKLKATIRLLQNDKILLKSRQTIQNKLNSDLKKEIQHLKSKLLYKESQLQKLNNENKNLLFKKTAQFRQEQERKENQVIQQLRTKLLQVENQKNKLEQSNEFLGEENVSLKEKEKNLVQEMSETETKYDNLVKKLNEEIEELQFQLNNVKNDYMSLLNAGNLKKKKSLGIAKQPSNVSSGNHNSRDSNFGFIIHDNFAPLPNTRHNLPSTCDLVNKKRTPNLANQSKQLYLRPIKWGDTILGMMKILKTLESSSFTVQHIIQNVEENNEVKCCDLISMFCEEPFQMSKAQAATVARYIVEDSSLSSNQKVLYNQNLSVTPSLARTILTKSIQKLHEANSQQMVLRWNSIFAKTKKLLPEVKKYLSSHQNHFLKDEFIEVVDKASREKVRIEEYDFWVFRCFDKDQSDREVVLSSQLMWKCLKEVINVRSLDDVGTVEYVNNYGS